MHTIAFTVAGGAVPELVAPAAAAAAAAAVNGFIKGCIQGFIGSCLQKLFRVIYNYKAVPLLQSQMHYEKHQMNDFPASAATEVHQHLLRS
jgi:hypothetical protein